MNLYTVIMHNTVKPVEFGIRKIVKLKLAPNCRISSDVLLLF